MKWRELFELQMAVQLSTGDWLEPAFPSACWFLRFHSKATCITRAAPEVLSSPWFPVDGAGVFQARPNTFLSTLDCTKPKRVNLFIVQTVPCVFSETLGFYKAGIDSQVTLAAALLLQQ